MPASRFRATAALASCAMMMPFFLLFAVRQWPISGDFLFYATALKAFSAQLWSGELYPRWLTEVSAGYGSPVFLFYAPLPFYVGSLFQFMAGWDTYGFYR